MYRHDICNFEIINVLRKSAPRLRVQTSFDTRVVTQLSLFSALKRIYKLYPADIGSNRKVRRFFPFALLFIAIFALTAITAINVNPYFMISFMATFIEHNSRSSNILITYRIRFIHANIVHNLKLIAIFNSNMVLVRTGSSTLCHLVDSIS